MQKKVYGGGQGEYEQKPKESGRGKRIREYIADAAGWVAGIFYPRRCPVCMEIVVPQGELIHRECQKKLCYIHEPACKRCGRQISRMEKEYCSECIKKEFYYLRGYAVWQYEEKIQHSLAAFKYHSRKEFSDFYAAEAVRLYGERIRNEYPDVLLPVPIHPKRRAERGFNQTELLADRIGRALDIPVNREYLVRIKRTKRLKELSSKERVKMLKDAFVVRKEKGAVYHSVMLVDDIYTTGSTVNACAAALRQAGVKKVVFLCMAIGASTN